ncbi:hypothetical protein VTJ83DRAFT_3323 [Remersonia thermophila]|uniref:Uncharacterized protein n=1 Tax=Remersonia thermophila TaxID=72144 RepID=A0ABR4DDS9_9PEZI
MGPTADGKVAGANTHSLGYTPASFAASSLPCHQRSTGNGTLEGSRGSYDEDVGRTLALLAEAYSDAWDDWTLQHDDNLALPRLRKGRTKQHGKAPRGLASMCLRVLADNIHAADRRSIDDIRLDQRWQLWRDLATRNMSLHAWNIVGGSLASSCQEWLSQEAAAEAEKQRRNPCEAPAHGRYGGDKERMLTIGMYRYHKEIFHRGDALIPHLIPMIRLDQCLVHLCLEDVERFWRCDLVLLTDLPLRVLELVQQEQPKGDIVLDHRLYEAWAQRAEKACGFSKLLVLRIISEWHTISETEFQHLSKFPALGIVDITLPVRLNAMPGWTRVRVSEDATFFEAYTQALLGHGVTIDPRESVDISNTYYIDSLLLRPIPHSQPLRPVDAHRRRPRNHRPAGRAMAGVSERRTGMGLRQPWRIPVHQVFTFLGLYDHKTRQPNAEDTGFSLAVNRIPVPSQRFVHVRLSTVPGVTPQTKRLCRILYARSDWERRWRNDRTGSKDGKENEAGGQDKDAATHPADRGQDRATTQP